MYYIIQKTQKQNKREKKGKRKDKKRGKNGLVHLFHLHFFLICRFVCLFFFVCFLLFFKAKNQKKPNRKNIPNNTNANGLVHFLPYFPSF
jgi:heme/copper-type cytochrome/quinol oxidase subunit 2